MDFTLIIGSNRVESDSTDGNSNRSQPANPSLIAAFDNGNRPRYNARAQVWTVCLLNFTRPSASPLKGSKVPTLCTTTA
jgi:hypothetical protein